MAKAKNGALMLYCGHKAVFVCDIYRVGNVNVIHANGPISEKVLSRHPEDVARATHHFTDFPINGFWKPQAGIFVVPASQVKEVKR